MLNITAEAAGLSEYPEELRLRLVVVEDDVSYTAANGILVHNGVARGMPGGAKGIAPANGKLAYRGQFSLPKLKRELDSELVLVEQLEACFQLMEIRAVLGRRFVGFNTGRWDYINRRQAPRMSAAVPVQTPLCRSISNAIICVLISNLH